MSYAEEALAFLRDGYSSVGARPCPACLYEDGRFIRPCRLHAELDEVEKVRDTLARELEFARHDLIVWKNLCEEAQSAGSQCAGELEVALIHKREAELAANDALKRIIALSDALAGLTRAHLEVRRGATVGAWQHVDSALALSESVLSDPDWLKTVPDHRPAEPDDDDPRLED